MVPAVGSFFLGLTIGWLVRYFLERFTEFNAKLLSSVVTVLCGGTVVTLLKFFTRDANLVDAVFWYPIGLPFGLMLLYPLVLRWDNRAHLWKETDEQWAKIWAERRAEKAKRRLDDQRRNEPPPEGPVEA